MTWRPGETLAWVGLAALASLPCAATLAAGDASPAPALGDVEPPPFVTPLMIADYLNGARTFTAAEASQADFNHSGLIEVGDIVVRVNQFTGGSR